ncbi:MAG: glycoside hydrolase family 97 N-terminal domain-containing protein [Proteiniphilum sp.]
MKAISLICFLTLAFLLPANEMQKKYEITSPDGALKIRVNISDHFNEGYSLIARAYDEGVAYRFKTELEGPVIVKSEEANFNFSGSPSVWFPEADALMRSWERTYQFCSSIQSVDTAKFAITPVLFSYPEKGIRVVRRGLNPAKAPGSGGMMVFWREYPYRRVRVI